MHGQTQIKFLVGITSEGNIISFSFCSDSECNERQLLKDLLSLTTRISSHTNIHLIQGCW